MTILFGEMFIFISTIIVTIDVRLPPVFTLSQFGLHP